MAVELYDHQKKAIEQMKNGCILCGGVGSGKSRTAIGYFYTKECGGSLVVSGEGEFKDPADPKDLYIITTARKRDTLEWEAELGPFYLFKDKETSVGGIGVTVDSWNNIGKYTNVCNAFFIFDEQRVVGKGAWVKAFLQIAKKNRWILLSATPGDTWSDYIPVFIANGFYKNRTEFNQKHCVYSRWTKYPKIDHYVNCGRLIKLRQMILVNMEYIKPTVAHDEVVVAGYDKERYKQVMMLRWDIYNDCPIQEVSKLCYLLRRVANEDPSRIEAVKQIISEHPRCIIFYNFDYELELLRELGKNMDIYTAEWNGHKHMPVPDSNNWIYLVQYTAGAEGWNCITTNVIIFYSQNYSYKTMIQAAGRIDRLNTPYSDLYYYHVRSDAVIDIAISRSLQRKKDFNEKKFITM